MLCPVRNRLQKCLVMLRLPEMLQRYNDLRSLETTYNASWKLRQRSLSFSRRIHIEQPEWRRTEKYSSNLETKALKERVRSAAGYVQASSLSKKQKGGSGGRKEKPFGRN